MMKVFGTVLFVVIGAASAADLDLLPPLVRDSTAAIQASNARVFRDSASGTLTLTFDYAQGEPEIRIPVRDVGWPTDWSQWRALQLTFETTSLEALSIGFSDGSTTKAFMIEPLPGLRIAGVIPFGAFVQTRTMTPLLPLGYKVWLDRLFTFKRVEEVVFRMRYPNQTSQLTLFNLTLRDDVPEDDILTKKPLIDRFGQWIPENWPGKVHGESDLQMLWAKDRLAPESFATCPAGGYRGRTLKSTGFFRVENDGGRWVFVDPHGHPFFSAGMDLVGYKQGSFATNVTRRQFLFEQLPSADSPAWLTPHENVSFYIENIWRRFGPAPGWPDKWKQHIVDRLRNWGFNTVANWSDYDVATTAGMPYVLPLEGWTTKKMFPFPWDFPDVFSSEFERNVDAAAEKQVAHLKNDANLIGWFIGNEPHWARSFGSLTPWPEMLLADPEPSATQDKLRQMLAANPEAAASIKNEFLYTCAQRYFEVITAAIRRHDPNHLVLGIRFAENPNDRWVAMSRGFDVFSVNIYSREFMPNPKDIERYSKISGKPVLIGEFTAAAPGRGMQGLFYWGHKVRDQEERGKAYRYYVENSAANPHIIGTHWFQLVDDLPTGRPSDEERLNYGFLNVLDVPYPELVKAARQTHRRMYELKYGRVRPSRSKPLYN